MVLCQEGRSAATSPMYVLINWEIFKGNTETVFVASLPQTYLAFVLAELTVEELFLWSSIGHVGDMACPSQLCHAHNCDDVGGVCLPQNLRVGDFNAWAISQPCLTPRVGKLEDLRWIFCPQGSHFVMELEEYCSQFAGAAKFLHDLPNPFPTDHVEALVRSINVVKRTQSYLTHFSCSWRVAKIMSLVPRPSQTPHWLSKSLAQGMPGSG